MLFKKEGASKANAFWKWFSANNHSYLFISEVDEQEKERLMDELLGHLHDYCEHLFFEIGAHPKEDDVELVITAEGVREYFEKVEELVDAAPPLPRWRVVKYKQPNGPGFVLDYQGKKFDPETILFVPLHSEEHPESIGIRVCYPDYNEEERNIFLNGTYIVIDSLIGEQSAVLDIDYLEVDVVPEDAEEEEYPMLSSLGQLIKERKHLKYPIERFQVVESTDNNGYLIFITANFSYLDYKYKSEFPWLLLITLPVLQYNENGHPIGEEAEALNLFESFLEQEISATCIAQYIGRVTLYKKRELYYHVNTPYALSDRLKQLLHQSDLERDFSFKIEKDEEWKMATSILREA
ncbi:MAG: hypothetical protein DI538_05300 [Azospira oryzae]|nr:MAG: hypothetical protein DI538_05300 [Azospira oryzae]